MFIKPELNKNFFAFLLLFAIFAFSFLLNVKSIASIPLCPFKFFTHFDCPGCGLTRSFIYLSHGDFLNSIRMNALGPTLYLVFFLSFIRFFLNCFFDSRFFNFQVSFFKHPVSCWSFALLFWGQWVLKIWKAF